jgi:hypothetical protein
MRLHCFCSQITGVVTRTVFCGPGADTMFENEIKGNEIIRVLCQKKQFALDDKVVQEPCMTKN